MPVDRGSLTFTITIEDQFSTKLKAFQDGLDAASQSFTDFKNGAGGISALAAALDALNKSTRDRTAGAKDQLTAEDRLEKLIEKSAEEEALRTAAVQAGVNVATLRKKALTDLQAAEQKLADTIKNEQINELANQLAQQRGIQLQSQRTAAARAAAQAAKEAADAEAAAARQLDSIKVAIGNLASDVITRATSAIAGLFTSGVEQAIDLNRQIENATLSIASLILATGTVADATGAAATGARAFALAQGEARRQTQALAQDALKTRASFESLLQTFQVAVAPGVEAGFNLDQLRQFTVQFSQAAQALGVQENLFALEIRQILSGTIQNRTRVATALNLTPQDITTAKETGQLFELLQQKFQAFTTASQGIGETFDGILGQIKNVFGQILQQGSLEFFNSLKNVLKDVLALLATKTPEGTFQINPAVLDEIKTIGHAFSVVIEDLRPLAVFFAQVLPGAIGSSLVSFDVFSKVIGDLGLAIESLFKLDFSTLKAALGQVVRDAQSGLEDIDKLAQQAATISLGSKAGQASGQTTIVQAQTLSKIFDALPAQISLANVQIEKQSEVFKQLDLDTAKAREALLQGTADFGISGAALQERQAAFKALFDLAQQTKQLTADQHNAELQLQAAQQTRLANETKINALGFDNRDTIENVVILGKQQLAIEAQLAAARDGGDQKAADQLQTRLDATKTFLNTALSGLDATTQANFANLAKIQIEAQGREAVAQDTLQKIGAARLAVENKINDALNQRLQLAATNETRSLNEQNALLAVQLAGVQKVNAAKDAASRGTGSQFDVQVAEANAAVQNQLAKIQEQTVTEARTELALRNSIADARAREAQAATALTAAGTDPQKDAEAQVRLADATKTRGLLEQQLTATKTANNAQDQIALGALADVTRKQTELNTIAERPITFGFQKAFQDFRNTATIEFNSTVNILNGIVNTFASTVAQTIVDAFDPTKKVDLRQRFATFLQDISKLIIETLTQIAVKKAILAGIDIAGSIAGSFAQGGEVRGDAGYEPSLAHLLRPQGFRAGGAPRGVDPRDTVPIWTQPGEWVMRLDAVRRYGADVMQALNSGLIDPMTLRGLAGSRSVGAIRRPTTPSFAAGGLISDQLAVTQRPSAGDVQAPVVRAVVVPDERGFERQLAGGRNALLRFMQDNAGTIRGFLGQGRS